MCRISPDAPNPAPLEYAPPPRWHQRPWFRRLLRRAVLLALLVLGIYWAVWGWRALQIARAERGVMRYAAANVRVAYDDDPQTYPQLLAGGGYTSRTTSISGNAYALYENLPYRRWVKTLHGSENSAAPAVFVHERTSPKGNRRIVIVHVGYDPSEPIPRFHFMPSVGIPSRGTALAGGAARRSSHLSMFRKPPDALRIYDGRPDRQDDSRFTIDVDYDGLRMTITGKLRDDDTVELTPDLGLVADFTQQRWWMPPGVDVPEKFEPSYFVDIATTQPALYPAPSQRGLRVVSGKKGFEIEFDRRFGATSRPATTQSW